MAVVAGIMPGIAAAANAAETPSDRAMRLELIQTQTRERKRAANRREVSFSNNLTCLMLLVKADLKESQRETLYNAMYTRNMDARILANMTTISELMITLFRAPCKCQLHR
eukprot:2704007-Amphidinium_carterae.1